MIPLLKEVGTFRIKDENIDIIAELRTKNGREASLSNACNK